MLKRLVNLLFFVLASAAVADDSTPIFVGETHTIESDVLNETRSLWLAVPEQCRAEPCPLLVLTDADTRWLEAVSTSTTLTSIGQAPPLVVLGVVTAANRNRDLTQSNGTIIGNDGQEIDFPDSGGSNLFLDFLETEVLPWAETQAKLAPMRIISGHSFGGLFALHAFASRPHLFGGVLAFSPTLEWDEQLPIRELHSLLEENDDVAATLVATIGDEGPAMERGFKALEKLLKKEAPTTLRSSLVRFPQDDHSSTPLPSIDHGLRFLFDGFRPPRQARLTPKILSQHYAELSDRMGYEILPPENALNQIGYDALFADRLDDAIALLEWAIELRPDAANPRDSLGDAYERAGRLEDAKKSYAKAVELGQRHPFRAVFERNLRRVTAELETRAKS